MIEMYSKALNNRRLERVSACFCKKKKIQAGVKQKKKLLVILLKDFVMIIKEEIGIIPPSLSIAAGHLELFCGRLQP